MKEAIPGLDASLWETEEGRCFWAINADWNPLKVERRSEKRAKKKARDKAEEPERPEGLWDCVAERGVHPELAGG